MAKSIFILISRAIPTFDPDHVSSPFEVHPFVPTRCHVFPASIILQVIFHNIDKWFSFWARVPSEPRPIYHPIAPVLTPFHGRLLMSVCVRVWGFFLYFPPLVLYPHIQSRFSSFIFAAIHFRKRESFSWLYLSATDALMAYIRSYTFSNAIWKRK